MWPIQIQDAAYNAFKVGRKAVSSAGTPVQLASDYPCRYVIIQALIANTGNIYWGDDSDNAKVATGMQLLAGASVVIPIDNLSKIWLDSDVNSEGVCFFVPKNQ